MNTGNAVANPKEDMTMTKLTLKLMIATAALVAAAGAASAQTLNASIPFEFRANGRVMAPGRYQVDLSPKSGTRVFRLSNLSSGSQALLLGQVPVGPEKAWEAGGGGALAFECASGSCALAEIWGGTDSRYAYTIHRPKLGKDGTAVLRVIPLQVGKGE
jgi:hypothetical protein